MQGRNEYCTTCSRPIEVIETDYDKDIIGGGEGFITFENSTESRYSKSETFTFYICDSCVEKKLTVAGIK